MALQMICAMALQMICAISLIFDNSIEKLTGLALYLVNILHSMTLSDTCSMPVSDDSGPFSRIYA